ncbi:hypothetical protein PGT21_023482 [Puccinia graminis f. sp. tritici]|uniref:Uncharacterized protein n=1 Tax=Puccinia graminis f. sp. tritici TaxID=56615 RepID=A0A5B0PRT1_PUCGR|nr:hypothetical protein PGTUg99_026843 [Puccinia graminis f. sp. tritici]KAA1104437.1 hypothetical protein PGT21_023482 [Puccinia graminis f. sp. tritici]
MKLCSFNSRLDKSFSKYRFSSMGFHLSKEPPPQIVLERSVTHADRSNKSATKQFWTV